ncbi:MAG: DUF6526 family protein [Bryobacteraceae bacterium]
MAEQQQSFASHTRWDPPFHFFAVMIFLANIPIAVWFAWKDPTFPTIWGVLVSLAFAVIALRSRLYAIKVQDRLIRLEERLRLMRLWPESMHSRIGELTESQLIGLRFASDGEVAELAKKALADKMERTAIKQAIKTWRPDHWRV